MARHARRSRAPRSSLRPAQSRWLRRALGRTLGAHRARGPGIRVPRPPGARLAVAAEAGTALSRATRRAGDPLQALAIAVLSLLVWQPAWAGDLGFQLSCIATLGLVAIGGPLARAMTPLPAMLRGTASALATTL